MSPRPDVSAERRTQIIQAALVCFTRKGYNNTTMDDIVAESGLSKGTLYWYFESKDALFASALMSVFVDVGQEAVAALEQWECHTSFGSSRPTRTEVSIAMSITSLRRRELLCLSGRHRQQASCL